MGYYSELAICEELPIRDASITPPEQQLLWRLEELRDLLQEMNRSEALYGGVCRFTEEALRYAPLVYFHTVYDVECAIALAIDDLKNKYAIEAAAVPPAPDTLHMEDSGSKLPSLLQILCFHPGLHRLCMA